MIEVAAAVTMGDGVGSCVRWSREQPSQILGLEASRRWEAIEPIHYAPGVRVSR
jgi:hypothetical protein